MQKLHSETQLQTSLPANRDSDRGTRPTRRSRTYRIRGIHESFDCVSLKSALCTRFGVESDELTLRSLAYDATYRQLFRQKVATVTFNIIPDTLGAGNRWEVEISLPGEKSQELQEIFFDTTFEGFTPLTAVEQEKNTTVDCILIHGWAGHSMGSFSSPDGDWIWPVDGLCHDIPTLRVWLYGFSSDLRNPISTAGVHEYASTFRRALVDSRRLFDTEIVTRPIIYIVHSLGGLILQDTINEMAASQHPVDKMTLEMTRAAFLFGVPMLGMETRALASLTRENDLPAAYTASLLDERYGFSQRTKEADKFYATCAKAGGLVYAFYETEKTPTVCQDNVTRRWVRNGPEELLVKAESATYGCTERGNMIAWMSNHNNMLKLRKGDVHYQDLLNRLREVQRIEKKQNKWYLADEAIRTYYNSGGRLEIERLSGQKLPLEKCYINLALVDKVKVKKKQDEREKPSFSLEARLRLEADSIGEAVAVEDLFESRQLYNGVNILPRRIFIQGRAGVGKTTLCKKLVHEFLSGQIWQKFFDRLLWIPLRRLKSKKEYSWQDLIQDAHFLKDPKWQHVQKVYSEQFYDPVFLSRTLLLFDGLDEVSQSWPHDAEIYEFLADVISNSPNVIITSRPQANRFDVGRFDLELETLGFLPEQIDTYLKNCVSEEAVAEMKSFMIERPLIWGLLRIPIQLDAFCTTWRSVNELHMRNQDTISTMTTLYNSILFDLCRKDILRSGGAQQSRRFSDLEVGVHLKNELRYLGELAFQGMVSNITEYSPRHQDRIGSYAMQTGVQLPIPYSAVLEDMSFLRTSEVEEDSGKRNYHFIHRTFQEFFAARHFAGHWQEDTSLVCLPLGLAQQQEELLPFAFLQKEKYNPRYNIFWRFVTGLIQIQSSEATASHQRDRHKNVVSFFGQLHEEPVDLFETAHRRLLMCCLSEVVSNGEGIMELRKSEENLLYEGTIKECKFFQDIVLGLEAEFPDSILCLFLKDQQHVSRTQILEALKQRSFIPSETFNVLFELLSEDELTPRQRIVAALIILKNSHIVSEDMLSRAVDVIYMMLNDEDTSVRISAAWPLAEQSATSQEALTALMILLEDENPTVRLSAAWPLARQPSLPPEALAVLMAALEHDDSRGRLVAADALLRHPSPSQEEKVTVATTLMALLKDEDSDIRSSAAWSLWKHPSLSQEAPAALMTLIEDEDADVRSSAVSALGQQSTLSQEAISALMAVFENEDEDVRVRSAAAIACTSKQDSPVPQQIIVALIAMLGYQTIVKDDYRDKAYSILRRCDIFLRIMDLDSQAWRQLWRYWVYNGQYHGICCYELEGFLYLWSDGILYTISTDSRGTRKFLDCVLAEYKQVSREQQLKLAMDSFRKSNKLEKRNRGLRSFLRKIVEW